MIEVKSMETDGEKLQQLIEERLRQTCKVSMPITMTIHRQVGRSIKVHFLGTQAVKDFADFIDDLIKGVRAKTLEEVKTHG